MWKDRGHDELGAPVNRDRESPRTIVDWVAFLQEGGVQEPRFVAGEPNHLADKRRGFGLIIRRETATKTMSITS
jgi:hypothetical protein